MNDIPPPAPRRISRRALLYGTAGAGVMLSTSPEMRRLVEAAGLETDAGAATTASKTLSVLSWQGYHDRPWLDEFTKKTGIKVNVAYVGGPAEMFAKVKANPSQYDVILNTAGWFSNYVKDGLLVPIDESRVPNIKLISNVFPWRKATTIGGKSYGVLYNWGDTPLGWSTGAIPGKYDLKKYMNPSGLLWDWNVLWDPQLKGKISIFDSPTDVFPLIGLAAGLKDPYHLNPAQLATVKKKLMDLRPQVKRLTSGYDDQVTQFVSKEAEIGYMNIATVAIAIAKKGVPMKVNHVVKQGVPAWSDNTSITKEGGAKKLDAVYQFINAGLTTPWQARFAAVSANNGTLSYQQATSAVAKKAGMNKAKLDATLIPQTRDPKFFPSLSFYQTINVLQKELDIWNEFKLGIG